MNRKYLFFFTIWIVFLTIMVTKLLLSSVLLVVSVSPVYPRSIARPKPVLLIPGNGGTQLKVKVEEQWAKPYPDCPKPENDSRIWLDVWSLSPLYLRCWSPMMEMVYDPIQRSSHSKDGFHIYAPDFGQTDSMEYIDTSWAAYMAGDVGAYYAPLVKELISWGYQKGVSLRGAAYDFRLGPHSQQDYYKKLKDLIETMYKENDNSKVVLIAHSAGGLFTLYFLNQQNPAWKDKYISSFVSLGTPWDGSPTVLHAFASGFNWGVQLLDPITIRQQQRTSETNMMLFPKQKGWNANRPFLVTNSRNYSLANSDEYFDDIGFPLGKELLKNVRTKGYDLNHPGVNVHCWYGTRIPTADVLVYSDGQFPNGQPNEIKTMDGDGTVTVHSLDRCQEWKNSSSKHNKVDVKQYPGQEHRQLLFEQDMFNDLRDVVY